jgi:hypothetical protein
VKPRPDSLCRTPSNGKRPQKPETGWRTLQLKISGYSGRLKIQTPLPVQAEAQIQMA